MEESLLTQQLFTMEETFLSFLTLLSLMSLLPPSLQEGWFQLRHNNLADLAPKHLLLQGHTRAREGRRYRAHQDPISLEVENNLRCLFYAVKG